MGTWFRWLWGWRGEVGLTAGPCVCAVGNASSHGAAAGAHAGTALGQLVLERVAHGEQIAYLRGFHRGMGWYR